jgi:hypothetical protein
MVAVAAALNWWRGLILGGWKSGDSSSHCWECSSPLFPPPRLCPNHPSAHHCWALGQSSAASEKWQTRGQSHPPSDSQPPDHQVTFLTFFFFVWYSSLQLECSPKTHVLNTWSPACRDGGAFWRWHLIRGSYIWGTCPWKGHWDPHPSLSLPLLPK